MKKKKILQVLASLAVILLVGLAVKKPVYNLYRDISFDWTPQTVQAREIRDFARAKGLSIGEWPYEIIGLYENNPETRDFVLGYPFRQETEITLEEDPSREVPLFLQWDKAWGYRDYGSSCLAVTGCGPTSLAMAGYYLTGDQAMNPADIADFAEKNGYYAPGYGSSWTLISEGGPELGLQVRELPLVKKKMVDALEAGNPVILALGKGDFTDSGHYIVLTGHEEDGFRVNDPNSRANSEKLWSYERLEGQIRNIWEISLG